MKTKEEVISQIREAFSENDYPGDWCLKGSTEGDEPYSLEEEFKGKTDWSTLDAKFLDQSPGGLSSALSFFSDKAFRFYLPAYLIADIEEKLESTDPVYHLTHGFDDSSRSGLINPRRYGGRTWFDEKRGRFAMFTREEVKAIVLYLELKMNAKGISSFEREPISQALNNYWKIRERESQPRAEIYKQWRLEEERLDNKMED